MQKSRKKFWLITGITVLSIVALIVVSLLATRLKTVTVEFRTRVEQVNSQLEEGVLDNVKETGEFKKKSLLFYNLDENIAKIEKSNPYVKVEQVIRKFPSTLRVYISERTPKFRVEDGKTAGKWYILDSEFKVLDIVTDDIKTHEYGSTTYYAKTAELNIEGLKVSAYIGDFVNAGVYSDLMDQIVDGVVGRATEFGIVNKVEITKNGNDYKFLLTMKNSGLESDDGCQILVDGSADLKMKIFAGVSCFCTKGGNTGNVDMSGKIIEIFLQNGEYKGIDRDK